jgi:dUTP pyrophosphatase
MNRITVNFVKTHDDAQLPKFNIEDPMTGDIGADLYSVGNITIPAKGSNVVPVGLTVGFIEPGYYFIISPRSGLGFKSGIQPHLGRIDNQYRGDIGIKLFNFSDTDHEVAVGDRIAQIEFHRLIQPKFGWVDEIEDTIRGDKGFGSSGN